MKSKHKLFDKNGKEHTFSFLDYDDFLTIRLDNIPVLKATINKQDAEIYDICLIERKSTFGKSYDLSRIGIGKQLICFI